MSSAYHIIGDKDTVLGYRFAGVTGETVENEEQAGRLPPGNCQAA